MNTVISKFEQLTSFFNHLKQIDSDTFYEPIDDNKWSTAAIVAHFHYWDQKIASERLPVMISGGKTNGWDGTVEAVNRRAATYARTRSMQELIDQAIVSRLKLAERLHACNLATEFQVDQKTYSILEYVEMLCKHDEQHVKEVASFLYSSYIGESIHSLQINS
ncbi:hypothetical protein CR205_18465 [Alteribacter lacisalsi]|uniref:DinB-like domain-containing protein n=1 Tax=Alteribacter lacisalsi TaxID=2045244 RepID=A0A2W0HDY1_9BACI|nr:DinB family protein [Alteribacter lacisalsi]PYZ95515.1 hypothetical protein CR205_18465 [Alteribacter lacisalsi]